MFTGPQEPVLRDIERETKTTITCVQAPQVADLVKSSEVVLVEQLTSVEEEVLPHFTKVAESLIEQRGATEALSAAIAHIVGYDKKRSEAGDDAAVGEAKYDENGEDGDGEKGEEEGRGVVMRGGNVRETAAGAGRRVGRTRTMRQLRRNGGARLERGSIARHPRDPGTRWREMKRNLDDS